MMLEPKAVQLNIIPIETKMSKNVYLYVLISLKYMK